MLILDSFLHKRDMASLLSLPIDLLESIAIRVSKRNTKDHFSMKMTCKALKDISEFPSVYASVYLFDLDFNNFIPCLHQCIFMKECYDHGNPCAVYMKGCQDYFCLDKKDDGLANIRLAADKGSMLALYTYAMVRSLLWDDSTHLSLFTRQSIRPISSDFLHRRRDDRPRLPDFIDKRSVFEEEVLCDVYTCECTPCEVGKFWYDNFKGPNMCDKCFWLREFGIFFRFFGFMASPDTIDW